MTSVPGSPPDLRPGHQPAPEMLEKAADPARVGRWLAERLSDSGWLDCQLRVVGHGRSNLTFRVDSAAGAVVLRHPPVGSVAATAHDMGRERRVMSAPAGTDVPVPGVLAWSEGVEPSDPVDAPCYVMELVDGIVPLVTPPPNWAGPAERTASAHALVDVLAGVLARARAGAMPPSAAEGLSEGIPPLVAVGHHVLAEGLA